MTASIADVTDALVSTIDAVQGLRAVGYPVDQPNPPMAIVALTTIDFHKAMQGSATYDYRVSLVFGRANIRGGWDLAEQYLAPVGAKSVRAALLADTTLGGLVSSLAVGRSIDIGSFVQQDTPFIVGSLEVTVHA